MDFEPRHLRSNCTYIVLRVVHVVGVGVGIGLEAPVATATLRARAPVHENSGVADSRKAHGYLLSICDDLAPFVDFCNWVVQHDHFGGRSVRPAEARVLRADGDHDPSVGGDVDRLDLCRVRCSKKLGKGVAAIVEARRAPDCCDERKSEYLKAINRELHTQQIWKEALTRYTE